MPLIVETLYKPARTFPAIRVEEEGQWTKLLYRPPQGGLKELIRYRTAQIVSLEWT